MSFCKNLNVQLGSVAETSGWTQSCQSALSISQGSFSKRSTNRRYEGLCLQVAAQTVKLQAVHLWKVVDYNGGFDNGNWPGNWLAFGIDSSAPPLVDDVCSRLLDTDAVEVAV